MISTTTNKVRLAGDGNALLFIFPYQYIDATNLVVTLFNTTNNTEIVQTSGVDYTPTPSGHITFNIAPSAQQVVVINRVVPITQLLQYISNDSFPSVSTEGAFDKLTFICQMLAENLSRCIQVSGAQDPSKNLIVPASRASKVLAFDSSGNLTTQ